MANLVTRSDSVEADLPGELDYRVTLSGEVDADGVDAELEDGVLTVRIPKPARAQPRRIEVKGG